MIKTIIFIYLLIGVVNEIAGAILIIKDDPNYFKCELSLYGLVCYIVLILGSIFAILTWPFWFIRGMIKGILS